MSPELETLDQLAGGDLSLTIVRKFYPEAQEFIAGVLGLLSCGDVRLLAKDGSEVPRWQWRHLFVTDTPPQEWDGMKLTLTKQGARKV